MCLQNIHSLTLGLTRGVPPDVFSCISAHSVCFFKSRVEKRIPLNFIFAKIYLLLRKALIEKENKQGPVA